MWLESLDRNSRVRSQYESNENSGCRFLFREDLEITFFESDLMYFAGKSSAPTTIRGNEIYEDHEASENPNNHDKKIQLYEFADYSLNKMYIHNEGITLPYVGETYPSESQIYESWKNGVAANPFFTDTFKTS